MAWAWQVRAFLFARRWPWVARTRMEDAQAVALDSESVADSLRAILQVTREELQTVRYTCRNRGDELERMRAKLDAASWDVAFADARAEEAGRRYAEAEKGAARWRQRALDDEANGPTCADVQAVYEENVRLRARVADLEQQQRDTLPDPGSPPKYR